MPSNLTSSANFSFVDNQPVGTVVYNATWFNVNENTSSESPPDPPPPALRSQWLFAAVGIDIVGGNDNGGQPAFAVDRFTGELSLASVHSATTFVSSCVCVSACVCLCVYVCACLCDCVFLCVDVSHCLVLTATQIT